jgi:hypothetical protein
MYNLSVDREGRIVAGRITRGLRHSQAPVHQYPGASRIGWLHDLLMAEDQADLIVIDAASMTELARLNLPQRVPFGVHATWLDTTDLASIGTA